MRIAIAGYGIVPQIRNRKRRQSSIYITSAVLRHIPEASVKPTVAVLMVQKEAVNALRRSRANLSLLAISVQFFIRRRRLYIGYRRAFSVRRLKVDSSLRLDLLPGPAVADVGCGRNFLDVMGGVQSEAQTVAE
ncbi:MAG: hypothetical protein U0175_37585 [Caldilineaceae bacterium]